MANYKENTLTATTWQRAKAVTIGNPYNSVPWITFDEEQVINIGADLTFKDAGSVGVSLTNPTDTFDLISPVDGSKLGTASYQDVYVMLSSLYLNLAAKRDSNTL